MDDFALQAIAPEALVPARIGGVLLLASNLSPPVLLVGGSWASPAVCRRLDQEKAPVPVPIDRGQELAPLDQLRRM